MNYSVALLPQRTAFVVLNYMSVLFKGMLIEGPPGPPGPAVSILLKANKKS